MPERKCPGEKGPIPEAICRARQSRNYHLCADCESGDPALQGKNARIEDDPRHKVFKQYDIRGTYPDEIDEKLAELIGMATGRFLNTQSILVGRDMRLSSEALTRALIRGILTSGCNVFDAGLISTDANYFATAFYRQGGGVQVTASHNPPQYNGFKISREQAIGMSYESGLANIERIALGPPFRPVENQGHVETHDIMPDWRKHILSFVQQMEPLNVVIDAGNGMAGKMMPPVLANLPIRVTELFFKLDGSFPNHGPNPLKYENLKVLQETVLEKGADLGVAFDADEDRIVLVDEEGNPVPGDLLTAMLAAHLLPAHPKSTVVYDLRSSRVVAEEVKKFGGIAIRERVGHSFIKTTMRQRNAILGGELSGHYYWRENYFADSGAVTFIHVLNLLSHEGRSMTDLLRPLRRYSQSGEINFSVKDKEVRIEELARKFKEGRQDRLDGLTVEYDDWWFNVRPSNTEPVLRLNLEARTRDLMEEKLAEITPLLKG